MDDSLKGSTQSPIIFFDGVCNLCNRFVDWTIKKDREKIFRFAPLQGETARHRLGSLIPDFDRWSVVLIDNDGQHRQSTAALRIIARMGGIYKLAKIFFCLSSRMAGCRIQLCGPSSLPLVRKEGRMPGPSG